VAYLLRARQPIRSAPDLARTNYAAVLAGLDPELWAAYRDGDFSAGLQDHPIR
jgi:hypothetical protein